MSDQQKPQPDETTPGLMENRPDVRFGIRAKLITVTFMLLTAALGAIAFQGYRQFVDAMESYITSLNLQAANETVAQVAPTIRNVRQQMAAFSDTLDYAFADESQREAAIRERFTDFSNLTYLALHRFDQNDTDFYYNSGLLQKQNRTQESVKTAFSMSAVLEKLGQKTFQVYNVTRKPSNPLVQFVLRRSTAAGRDVVVVAEFHQELLLGAGGDASVYTKFLIDTDNQVLAHPDTSLMANRVDLSTLPVVQALRKSPLVGALEYEGPDGQIMIAGHAPIGDTGLGVLVQVPKSEAFRAVTLIAKRSLFIILVVGIISLFVTVYFSGSISRPVKELAAAAEHVAEGDFDQHVDVKTKDEIGALAHTFNFMTEGLRERDRVKQAFGRYVSKQVAEKILSVEDELSLEGESREVSVLFSDIRGFTSMSEQLPPRTVVNILNAYFRQMVDCVFRNDGSLDKYMGDAIMAVYGAPLTLDNKEWRAVKTALEMMHELKKLNAALRKRNTGLQLNIGIGINTGEVIAGNIGSPERLEYTIIGDNVNIGQRIEAATKPYNGGIMISHTTYVKVKDRIIVEKLDPIEVKGKTLALQLYRVMGERTPAKGPEDDGGLEPVDQAGAA